jgi:hypothetical protein
VLLVVLAGIWIAVLGSWVMGARAEGRPSDSIGDFRRQLTVLRRTGPQIAAANQLYGSRPDNVVSIAPVAVGSYGISRETARRRRTQKRRRDVFYGLTAGLAGTLLLGFLPGLRVMWSLHLLLDVLFVAYVALLIRMRNMSAEREMKVRFLPHGRTPEPALALRRSAVN